MAIKVKVPAFRSFDIKNDIDLIEEILRIYGFDKIEPQRPEFPLNTEVKKDPEKMIRDFLSARGFFEVITFPWIENEYFEIFSLEAFWEILNPLNKEQSKLRTSLIPSLVKTLKFNHRNFNYDLAIFEIGKIYLANEEVKFLGILATGNFIKHFSLEKKWDFITFKGVIESILEKVGVNKDYKILPAKKPFLHPYLQAKIEKDGKILGYFGKIHPDIAKKLEIREEYIPFVGELNFSQLMQFKEKTLYKPFSKYPPVHRDLSLVYDEEKGNVETLLKIIKDFLGEILEELYIFDVYKGEKIGKGKISVALHLGLRHPEKSLSAEEVNTLLEDLINQLEENGYFLRK